MPTIKLKTPAKVNFILSILKKRLDNYHEIETIFQTVSLFDIISVDYKESGSENIRIKSTSTEIPLDQNNLVYKAVRQFLSATNIKADITIKIEKNIPVAAGLGGGSSDAACVLKALNKINLYPLKEDVISRIAYSLGADVNFFIKGGTSIGKGVGDILQPINSPDINLVIVKPRDLQISSGWAYEKYDQLSIKPARKKVSELMAAIESNNIEEISNNLFNSLEYAVFKEYPQLKNYKELLIKAGCYNAILSGSGPAVFGIARDEASAKEISDKITGDELQCFAVRTLLTESRIS